MSKQEQQIKKNLTLSAAFSTFIVSHPEIMDEIPSNAEIIFSDKRDPSLKKENRKLVDQSTKDVYEVEKSGSQWKVSPLSL